MSSTNPIQRAREARDHFALALSDHPDVSLIDIGQGRTDPSSPAVGPPVVRIHLRRPSDLTLTLPSSWNGVPIEVTRGDYQPEKEVDR